MKFIYIIPFLIYLSLIPNNYVNCMKDMMKTKKEVVSSSNSSNEVATQAKDYRKALIIESVKPKEKAKSEEKYKKPTFKSSDNSINEDVDLNKGEYIVHYNKETTSKKKISESEITNSNNYISSKIGSNKENVDSLVKSLESPTITKSELSKKVEASNQENSLATNSQEAFSKVLSNSPIRDLVINEAEKLIKQDPGFKKPKLVTTLEDNDKQQNNQNLDEYTIHQSQLKRDQTLKETDKNTSLLEKFKLRSPNKVSNPITQLVDQANTPAFFPEENSMLATEKQNAKDQLNSPDFSPHEEPVFTEFKAKTKAKARTRTKTKSKKANLLSKNKLKHKLNAKSKAKTQEQKEQENLQSNDKMFNELQLYSAKTAQEVSDSEAQVIKTFISQFENKGDITDFTTQLQQGVVRLDAEMIELSHAMLQNKESLKALEVLSHKLNGIVDRYEKKAEADASSAPLRLADELTLKELLKDMLHRQVQGMRVAPTDYLELKQVHPYVMNSIKAEVAERLQDKFV